MHYAEQVWAKRAEENERCRNIGTTIDICRRLGEYLEKSHKKISPPAVRFTSVLCNAHKLNAYSLLITQTQLSKVT